MKKVFLIFIGILFYFFGVSQTVGIGGSGMYNFQTESVGFGARVSLFPDNKLSYVPQITWYPSFNKISEYIIGLSLEYKVRTDKRFNYYALVHGGYNQWINANSSALKGAKTANWNLEGGIGISTTGYLRPFIEYRYNIKFQETHLRIGLLYILQPKRHHVCPAYG